ncbi:sulfate adenylyltransferase [Campylobacter sp. CCS1377]|uniref:Sulfate adenylyltransferase n=1 Tax=Campylobacter sp. CCS1377 TaxID=3158229 RepID=A0AAU7E605_9BACT|nr:sulfate adenylyltransferase [Campylobacter jejuni]
MALSRKNKQITIQKNEFEILSLIKEGMLGTCTHLMSEEERDEVAQTGKFRGEITPYSLTFSPLLSEKIIEQSRIGDVLEFVCEDKVVGEITLKSKFKTSKNVKDIFSPNTCSLDDLGKFCIGGEFEIYNSHIKKIKEDFIRVKNNINAQKITAIVSSFDPLHRAHERMFRWTIDKADLVVIFLIESYGENGLEFSVKQKYLQDFIQKYLPPDRVFVFPLKNIDIFHSHLNPVLESVIAKSLGCTKLVVGQNHTGLGMFYYHNQPQTILDDFSKECGIEIIVLPEFVFCEECKMIVSTKSCPHGLHHHMKYNSNSLRNLLRLGIIPPSVFMRREISTSILTHLFPNRFKNMQKLYNDLFVTSEIVERRKDEEFYEQLLKTYQMTYMV